MKKLILFALVSIMTFTFVLSGVASAGISMTGKHFNLNIIGFAQCKKSDQSDPDCFKGNAGDIQTNGHTIFVPIKTAQTENICEEQDSIMPTEMLNTASLDKGVRILVSDAGGEEIQVVDRDATDGTAKLNLPDGSYVILARALGKPGGCMDIDTVTCYDYIDDGTGTYTYVQVDCSPGLENDAWYLVGHLDVDRIKGVKPHWVAVTDELLPTETGVGADEAGYFDFFWQVFNDKLRLLQLRIYQLEE